MITYYLQLSGIEGDTAISLNGSTAESWIAIDGYDFAMSTPVPTSTGTGASSGRPSFNDLQLQVASNTAFIALLTNAANGKSISSARLIGVVQNGSDSVVQVIDLSGVTVTSVQQAAGQIGGYVLSLGYTTISQSDSPGRDEAGQSLPSVSTGYDLVHNKPISSLSGASLIGQTVSNSTTDDFQTPTETLIKVAGVNGASDGGWDKVLSYDFGITNSAGVAEGGGKGAAKASFGQIHLTMTLDASGLALLKAAETGQIISQLTLAGIKLAEDAQVETSTLSLQNVHVAAVSVGAVSSGSAPTYNITLDYEKIGVTTASYEGSTATFGWDVAQNKSTKVINATSGANSNFHTVTEPATYYLQLSGVDGNNSISLDGAANGTWIEVSDYSFGVSSSSSSHAAGTGVTASDFSDLQLSFTDGQGLTAFLQQAASGGALAKATLIGLSSSGHVVRTINLNEVQVSSAQLVTGYGSGVYQLTLNYTGIGESDANVDPTTGEFGKPTFTGYDLVMNSAVTSPNGIVARGQVASIAAATSSFPFSGKTVVKIDGTTGESSNYAGWDDILGYSFGVVNSSSSGASGIASFGDLSFTMQLDPTALALLNHLEKGDTIATLTLANQSKTGALTSSVSLQQVHVTSITESGSVGSLYTVAVSYDKIGVTPASKQSAPFGWDLLKGEARQVDNNTASTTHTDPQPKITSAGGYYLQMSGVNGNYAIDINGVASGSWIQASNYNLSASSPATSTQVGSPAFSDLQVNVPDDAALTSLLTDLAKGASVGEAKLIGVSFDGHLAQIIDLRGVLVSSVTRSIGSSGGQGYTLSLKYNSISQSNALQGDFDNSIATRYNTVSSKPASYNNMLAKNQTVTIADNQLLFEPSKETFIKIPGVIGSSQDHTYAGWEEVLAYSFSASNFGKVEADGSIVGGNASFSTLDLTMKAGPTEMAFLKAAETGEDISQLTLDGPNGSDDNSNNLMFSMFLQDVHVTSFSTLAFNSNNNEPIYNVSVSYEKLKVYTLPTNSSDHSPQEASFAYDLLTGTVPPACYCPGTLIETADGELAVEDLRVGDRVATLHGGPKPVKWIGRRSYDGRFIAGRFLMLPVCIKAGALGEAVPRRDLWVSPGHAIHLDGALVPAYQLLNGVSVIQAGNVEQVTYMHIELDEHDVLLAEGCAAESFLDEGQRRQFGNAAEFAALYPGERAPAVSCARRLDHGFELQAIRDRIAARAGLRMATAEAGPLRGYVDKAGPDTIEGWAIDESRPDLPVCLDILVGGRRVARALANMYRADVRDAGIGSGLCGFSASLPPGCLGRVEVLRSIDGAALILLAAQELLAEAA